MWLPAVRSIAWLGAAQCLYAYRYQSYREANQGRDCKDLPNDIECGMRRTSRPDSGEKWRVRVLRYEWHHGQQEHIHYAEK